MADSPVLAEVLEQIAALEDPRIREVNARHGDDHGVNLTKLRGIAKAIKTNDEFARELWATGETDARLLALLIAKPRVYSADELDAMLREARYPKVLDWLVNYIVKKSPHAEDLRVRWFDDPEPDVAAAGWALTHWRVNKNPDGLDQEALLDQVEAEMKDAPERLQWEMNFALTYIGVESPALRPRAIAIGEALEVLKDHPTPPGCTSPYAPLAIAELAKRKEG